MSTGNWLNWNQPGFPDSIVDAHFNNREPNIFVCSIINSRSLELAFCNPPIKSSNFWKVKITGNGSMTNWEALAPRSHWEYKEEKINFAFCIRNWQYLRFMGGQWQKIIQTIRKSCLLLGGEHHSYTAASPCYLCFKLSLLSFSLNRIKSKVASE